LNFIKSYFGEKYALQVAFLLHFQAWLLIPTIFGIACVVYNFIHAILSQEKNDYFDNYGNAIYGLFISLWASLMIESWQKTEKIIAFDWAIEKQALKKDDERTDDYIYNWIFNGSSNEK
jgi:hypothetical protein